MRNNKKDLFIETASKLFSLKGYHATGLNEILKASKAPKGSLYYYFPNGKEELALEAIRFTIHDILEQLQNRFEGFSNPCEAIVFHINFLADLIETNQRTKYLSLCLVALETYDSSEILRNACNDAFQMMEKFYMKRLLGFGFDQITAEELADLYLYRKIETRGFLIEINGKQIDDFDNLMITGVSINWLDE